MMRMIGSILSFRAVKLRLRLWLGLLGLVSLCSACVTPAVHFDERASQLGLHRAVLRGALFEHVVYRNTTGKSSLLHVYLEGDGTPWLNRYTVAADPTPRRPLMLALLARDPAAAVYLGRPCYHGYAATPPCSPLWWTARRYSAEVVDSMAAALRAWLAVQPVRYEGLVWLGHSGGAALAMLLAERFPETRAVLTIAGNLDPDAWAAYHHYSPLTGSLNPALRLPLPPRVVQLHFFGEHDQNIPVDLLVPAVQRQPDARLTVWPDFDHDCCWPTVWPDLLARLQQALTERGQVCSVYRRC